MVYNFYFTPFAEQDLDDILRYIAVELNNKTAARNLAEKVFEQIDNVCGFPHCGTLVENEFVADKAVRKLIIDNYVLYYKPSESEKKIYILRIVYGRRNANEILKNIK